MWVGCHLSKAGRGGMLCLDEVGGPQRRTWLCPCLRLRWVEETCPMVGLFWFTAYVRILYIVDPISG